MGKQLASFRQRLPAQPSSVGEARRLVRQSLASAGREDLVETAELLVSEVVTNALLHAGTPVDLAVFVADDGLRVEIGDGSPHFPRRPGYAATAGTGRGLMLLQQMVDEWGVVPNASGKTVWFQLDSGDRMATHLAAMDQAVTAATNPQEETVEVQLLNVPLLLHAAWQECAQALLREHLLANLDVDPGDDTIRLHAEATDAIALLADCIPRLEIGLHPNRVMKGAIEPQVSCPRVEMQVPIRSLRNFRTLDLTLEAAIALADEDVFLTTPTQPEVRSYRRWLCEQVEQQSNGADPTPWSAADEPSRDKRQAVSWDPTSVTESAQALIAADDDNRIIAASQPLLDLLGYDDRAQLVGQRIATIIPARYRQAHVAGFTLHFLTGHSPLLGKVIVVPATRCDGREVEVEVTVNSHSAPHGRKVFIAELLEPVVEPAC